jgi:Acetyltransferases, including N-acetylases of ribosomal proteins
MNLNTERLLLRPFTMSDAEDVFEYAADLRVGPAAGWPVHKDIWETQTIIHDVYIETDDEVYALQLQNSGKVIGAVSLQRMTWSGVPEGTQEIGYCLNPAYWGRGYMPEAVRELLRHGFEHRGLGEIWSGHYDFNRQSKRVIETCGWRYVTTAQVEVEQLGETRTELFYRMTRAEWDELSQPIHIL